MQAKEMQAKVQLWNENDDEPQLYCGYWRMWDTRDDNDINCYMVILNDTGQQLHIWLEGITGDDPFFPCPDLDPRLKLHQPVPFVPREEVTT